MKTFLYMIGLMILGGSLVPADDKPAIEVALRPAAVVSGVEVRLVDVATVSCLDAALAEIAGQTVVIASPPPGQSATLVAGFVVARLRPKGILPEQVFFTAARECVLTTAAQYLTQEVLEQRLTSDFALVPDQATGRVLMAPFAPCALPEGELNLQFIGPMQLADGLYIRLQVLVAGVTRGTWLLKLVGQPGIAAANSAEPTGTVPPGESPGLQVRSGSPVRLVVRAFGFELTTTGKLQYSARVGESARALNLSSGREVQGLLEAPDLLVVTLTSEEG